MKGLFFLDNKVIFPCDTNDEILSNIMIYKIIRIL